MQNAKDTFFVALRNRLAALNPDRTVVVRGAQRPAMLVLENELIEPAGDPADAFVLLWTDVATDVTEAMPLDAITCEIRYATAGTQMNAGMDRGRVLGQMDGELASVLLPYTALKQNFTTNPATAMSTTVFWSQPAFGEVRHEHDRVLRTATVQVFTWREAGEL